MPRCSRRKMNWIRQDSRVTLNSSHRHARKIRREFREIGDMDLQDLNLVRNTILTSQHFALSRDLSLGIRRALSSSHPSMER